MFGFFIGTACVVGLAVLAGRRHRHFHGGHGHHGGFRRRRLRRVLERLDTTPGQEKAIMSALESLREQAKAATAGLGEDRKRLAALLRGERLDDRAFAAVLDEPLARAAKLKDDLAKSVVTIHETLTPSQREKLSDLVESGPRFGYGHAHGCAHGC
jgi:Spy/CpxP family protein refolding chaperone